MERIPEKLKKDLARQTLPAGGVGGCLRRPRYGPGGWTTVTAPELTVNMYQALVYGPVVWPLACGSGSVAWYNDHWLVARAVWPGIMATEHIRESIFYKHL